MKKPKKFASYLPHGLQYPKPVERKRGLSLRDYWDELDGHDWFHAMSDDGSVWRAGQNHLTYLESEANNSPEHKKLFKEFQDHIYSGKSWKTPEKPKPKRP
jgi:hypothetical protein